MPNASIILLLLFLNKKLLKKVLVWLQVHKLFFFSLNVLGEQKRDAAYIYIYKSKNKNASSTNTYCKLHHIFRCFKEMPTQWYTHFVKNFVTQLTPHGVSNDPLSYCNWFFFYLKKLLFSDTEILRSTSWLS